MRRFPLTALRQGLRDHSARATNRAPAPQEHAGTGVSRNDELVNMNSPNAPGLGIKLGGCIHSERYYVTEIVQFCHSSCKTGLELFYLNAFVFRCSRPFTTFQKQIRDQPLRSL